MIQVCSRCGTRWNVRDRQRSWCPRCQGALLAPSVEPSAVAPGASPVAAKPADQGWGQRPTTGTAGGQPPRLPPGYRWIAVRPGAAPPPRHGPRQLGPTPRYSVIPRWGLTDHFDGPLAATDAPEERDGPSAATVRKTLIGTAIVVGAAVFIHLIRYVLLLVNRSVLLHPLVAGAATWFGVALSVLAAFAVVGSAVVLTNWLIARRASAYAVDGATDPRSVWELRAGALVPIANLVWAPVFVFELARTEGRLSRLRTDIVAWWCTWVVSYALVIWAFATSFTRDPQGIADNTVTTIVAYLAGLAALILAYRVVQGFERNPVDRPSRRWIVVPDDGPVERDAAVPVEQKQREPAA
ncbi:DUF4328 domain-containing protein [Mycolicibacterium lacusdiani]|uniref:DUF4328 domain-containing protein n=1 Tax=Mycolicibacterium lacusdiani TaxID=2895283 RepID=UPI001F1FCE5F|nr:DUF4328 domain-containing protein [Mycolicibacterium lacusdiani]